MIQFITGEILSFESTSTANAAKVACSVPLDEQNSVTTNEHPTSILEKELTSAKASSVHIAVDDEDDVSIIDELKNVDLRFLGFSAFLLIINSLKFHFL